MTQSSSLYETDFYAWSQKTATLIQEQQWHDIDWEHVAKEIRDLGQSAYRVLESRLAVLIRHLLKWQYQPERRQQGRSWQRTIVEQRFRISRILRQNPSLRQQVPVVVEADYTHICRLTSIETGLDITDFPSVCPWTIDHILADDFWPENPPGAAPH